MQHRFPWRKLVFFATCNFHKFNEARKVLSEFGLAMAMLRLDIQEIQNENIKNIAVSSVIDAVEQSRFPVIVEDAGLFIDALKGFPGPYSKYIYQTIGNQGVLNLLENLKNRAARFRSVVAFAHPGIQPKFFEGIAVGRISEQPIGISGFGFDPIFEPSDQSGKTFGSMTTKEKNRFSHRAKALRIFAKWYISEF